MAGPILHQFGGVILIRAHLQKLLWSHVLKLLLSTACTHTESSTKAANNQTNPLHILAICMTIWYTYVHVVRLVTKGGV